MQRGCPRHLTAYVRLHETSWSCSSPGFQELGCHQTRLARPQTGRANGMGHGAAAGLSGTGFAVPVFGRQRRAHRPSGLLQSFPSSGCGRASILNTRKGACECGTCVLTIQAWGRPYCTALTAEGGPSCSFARRVSPGVQPPGSARCQAKLDVEPRDKDDPASAGHSKSGLGS